MKKVDRSVYLPNSEGIDYFAKISFSGLSLRIVDKAVKFFIYFIIC
ncbi:MAG: hypothetical protein ABIK84_01595 [candidate division WOR-3 bacterium]